MRALRRTAVAAMFAWLAAGGAGAAPLTADEHAAITGQVNDLLANEPGLPLHVRQSGGALARYYGERNGRLIWVGTDRMPSLVERLRQAEADGLNPGDYPADRLARLVEVVERTDPRSKAVVELFFSSAFLRYASDLRIGRVLPRRVDPDYFLEQPAIDPGSALDGVLRSPSLKAFFDGWEPQSEDYKALKEALAQHRAIATLGGWPAVPSGETLKPDMSDPRVEALRARLAVTDPPSGAGAGPVYDPALANAVKRFQRRHGLDDDGIVGKSTVAALNVSVAERIEQISTGMERLRWMPSHFGSEYLIVNIAAFELKWIRQGEVYERMEVVVGKEGHRTPQFSNTLRTVEINPYWNVPAKIAVNEELPHLRRNAAARDAAGFEAVIGDRVIPVAAIDWSRFGPGNFPMQLRQRPGSANALGRVKFLFPNRFDVYLHDTPAKTLFSRADRAFSHGCVRLSRPIDLAVKVLASMPGWDRERVERVVASGERTVINLAHPIPINITYLTSWVEDGVVNFRNDVYRHDTKLANALSGRETVW